MLNFNSFYTISTYIPKQFFSVKFLVYYKKKGLVILTCMQQTIFKFSWVLFNTSSFLLFSIQSPNPGVLILIWLLKLVFGRYIIIIIFFFRLIQTTHKDYPCLDGGLYQCTTGIFTDSKSLLFIYYMFTRQRLVCTYKEWVSFDV